MQKYSKAFPFSLKTQSPLQSIEKLDTRKICAFFLYVHQTKNSPNEHRASDRARPKLKFLDSAIVKLKFVASETNTWVNIVKGIRITPSLTLSVFCDYAMNFLDEEEVLPHFHWEHQLH